MCSVVRSDVLSVALTKESILQDNLQPFESAVHTFNTNVFVFRHDCLRQSLQQANVSLKNSMNPQIKTIDALCLKALEILRTDDKLTPTEKLKLSRIINVSTVTLRFFKRVNNHCNVMDCCQPLTQVVANISAWIMMPVLLRITVGTMFNRPFPSIEFLASSLLSGGVALLGMCVLPASRMLTSFAIKKSAEDLQNELGIPIDTI